MERRLYFAVFSFGFASMAAQILIMRELLVVFYGNELSVGIMLAAWLFWVAAGSIAARSKRYTEEIFHLSLLSVAVLTPFTVFLIRNIRNILGDAPGQIIGAGAMALSSFVLLAPVCAVFGALFGLSCLLVSRNSNNTPSKTGKVYLIESAGAVAGGLAFNFIFVTLLGPLQTALFCGLLNTLAVLVIAQRKGQPFRWWATFAFMVFLAVFMLSGAKRLDFLTRQMQWKQFELVDVRDSRYGNITLTKLGPQFNIFENGLLVAATDDPLTAEESVHYAMLEHPSPKRVLLIGGSLSGSLEEILKHPVDSVDFVELDPELIRVGMLNYPKQYIKAFADPRAKAHYTDGRLFAKNLTLNGKAAYDVIILALPNPYTAQINRFYSLEFYREVKRLLDKNGVFSFGVTSSQDYISSGQAQFLGCLLKTLSEEFKEIKIVPGETALFLACPSAGVLTYDYNLLSRRIKERGLKLNYVNEHYLPDKFEPMRVDYLERSVRSARDAKINRDFRPIGYFYDMVLWSARTGSGLAGFFLAFISSLIVISWLAARQGENFPYVLSIGATGFSTMLLQIVLILAFQVVYGYVYHKIGLIFAAFMFGLTGGSVSALAIIGKGWKVSGIYKKFQLLLCLYCFALPFVFATGLRNEAAFFILPVVAGLIGGLQFPLAIKLLTVGTGSGRTAGILYGADLLGACAGALITSAILIPILGINAACGLTGLLNLLIFILLVARRD